MKKFERHGETRGERWTPEYRAYQNMISRCYEKKNISYKNYGGRGITVCACWRNSFAAFLDDVGRRPSTKHSLDRIKNHRGYVPGNVHWATPEEQARNTRANHVLTVDGVRHSLAEWVELLNVDYDSVKQRLYLGWSAKDALMTPTRKLVRQSISARAKIRYLWRTGKYMQREIAVRFDCTQSAISRIVAGARR